MKICISNVRSLYRAGPLTAAVVTELIRYELDLVDVQEVMWDRGGTVRAEVYSFFYRQGEANQLRTGFLVHHRIYRLLRE
jgi:hypothetical protein